MSDRYLHFMVNGKKYKQPKSPSTDEQIEKMGTYILWSTVQPKKRLKACHPHSIDGSGDYVMHKPGTERLVPHDLTHSYMKDKS
jgi:hypothetical protein